MSDQLQYWSDILSDHFKKLQCTLNYHMHSNQFKHPITYTHIFFIRAGKKNGSVIGTSITTLVPSRVSDDDPITITRYSRRIMRIGSASDYCAFTTCTRGRNKGKTEEMRDNANQLQLTQTHTRI